MKVKDVVELTKDTITIYGNKYGKVLDMYPVALFHVKKRYYWMQKFY